MERKESVSEGEERGGNGKPGPKAQKKRTQGSGKGRAEVVICRGETAEGEKRLQMKLLTPSWVSLEGAKASQTTAKWVVEYAPLAQVVHEPKRACPEQPRSGAWRRAEQHLATGRSRELFG